METHCNDNDNNTDNIDYFKVNDNYDTNYIKIYEINRK